MKGKVVTSKSEVQETITALRPSDLPAPPNSAITIVQACSDPEVGAQTLAKVVASDPVFTAEILRTVNSAVFGFRHEVASAAQAVAVLGNRALRNLALCLAVRDALKDNEIAGFDMLTYWEDALRRGVSARMLATLVGLDPQEAFTVGLLQDFGMLAMIYARPELAGRWEHLKGASPDDRYVMEHRIFGTTHDKVGLMLAKSWALPTAVAIPMACHHTIQKEGIPDTILPACKLANCADWLAAVYTCDDKKHIVQHSRALVKAHFQVDVNGVDNLLEKLPLAVEEAASSLGLRVSEQPRLEEIMRAANERLIEENLSYQELTWQLERTLAEKEQLAIQLQEANAQLQQLAYYDALTGLVNHGRFHEVFPAEIKRHGRSGRPLSLLMLDLDHFKSVNDTYGHPFGDTVLAEVAGCIKKVCRPTDIKARVGGEEMCVLLPDTDIASGQATAERVREAIKALEFHAPGRRVKVTASLGGCTWVGDVRNPDDVASIARNLMNAADSALYKSKHGGRNQTSWNPYPGS